MNLYKMLLLITFSFALLFTAPGVNAQINLSAKNTPEDSTVRKWEYCVIYRLSSGQTKDKKITGIVTITYFVETGERDENIEVELPQNSQDYNLGIRRALAKAFMKLGNEGWELIGKFPYAPVYSNESELGFMFKRPKQQ